MTDFNQLVDLMFDIKSAFDTLGLVPDMTFSSECPRSEAEELRSIVDRNIVVLKDIMRNSSDEEARELMDKFPDLF
ncbi:hypothetical protein YALI2_D00034g [Yarrowia lipolytica]|jgi:hypothetical protein|nr:hypothetical protein YALI2_D00034g [Yarrowia lipolytica]